MPIGHAIPGVSESSQKIDSTATDGLEGVEDSLAYRIHEVERHFHSYEHWFGLAAVPVGETHRADHMVMTPFQMDAGNDTWGSWLQILGSSDTPHVSGRASFDFHRMLVSDVERDKTLILIQLVFGEDADVALATDIVTELMFTPEKNMRQDPYFIQSRRQASATKIWARCWVDGTNTGTVDFFIGIHEYEG